jgi:diguanylate cyclase (GGDEF)-like protein
VVNDLWRLTPSEDLEARLRGLAAQAAIALRNAHLVEQIRYQAMHDSLTGLPNRALILDRADQLLARARRDGPSVSALFLDLDGFKEINDSFGHSAGDEVLRAVADRLASVVRETDTLGRLGGDELIVLMDGADRSVRPEVVAQRLLEVLQEPFVIKGHEDTPFDVRTSIGIASASEGGSPSDLLRNADIALYEAKSAGRNCARTFGSAAAPRSSDAHDVVAAHSV